MAVQTGIVHIGMNEGALDEARALDQANKGGGGALSVRAQPDPDVVVHGGVRYDLSGEAGREAYAAALGLSGATARGAVRLLGMAGVNAKDELAQVIRVYAEAETGRRRMERVVLSGHSVGSQIWGDGNGVLEFRLFRELAAVFPQAARTVEHLMISACYTGSERNLKEFQAAFPNLRSLWAYAGSSPGTWSGAIPHLKAWEKATERDRPADVDRDLARGTRKGEYVVTWNEVDGFEDVGWEPLDRTLAHIAEAEPVFQAYFEGEKLVTNSQTGPLRDYYNLLQRALAHPDLPSSQVDHLEERRDITIRLLYWDSIRKRFASAYGDVVTTGFAAAGLESPNFSRLDRREALAAIDDLEGAADAPEAFAALTLLREGLGELDSSVIPTSWV